MGLNKRYDVLKQIVLEGTVVVSLSRAIQPGLSVAQAQMRQEHYCPTVQSRWA